VLVELRKVKEFLRKAAIRARAFLIVHGLKLLVFSLVLSHLLHEVFYASMAKFLFIQAYVRTSRASKYYCWARVLMLEQSFIGEYFLAAFLVVAALELHLGE